MAKGWIRAYWEEYNHLKALGNYTSKDRAEFRKQFTTPLLDEDTDSAQTLVDLTWKDEVELPDGIGANKRTRVLFNGHDGFAKRSHLIELGFAQRDLNSSKPYVATLTSHKEIEGKHIKIKLLWGDIIQIQKREGTSCDVKARNWYGTMPSNRITDKALLDLFFVDVGQGDGVFVRFPNGKHLLIDAGLPRKNQMTGKNAVDFIDWKFYNDYGHYEIKLDGMVASHCDYDHYGGLWDMFKEDTENDEELDCIDLKVNNFYHAGLSRWKKKTGTTHPHKDDLGPNNNGWFTRLLDDRNDAETSLDKNNPDTLKGYWNWFIRDIIDHNPETSFTRLGVKSEGLQNGMPLPEIWKNETACAIKVLAPVTKDIDGKPTLKDLGDTGKNTNGHSICLRLDYGKARILLTGDLNSKSMDWLTESYGDRIAAFNCDVAKACHHGSHDISYKFLEHIKAGATVISSGDAEGFAHPRPEVVAASAVTGFVSVDREKDKLITPLIYMTEIERSVSLGKVSHIRFNSYPKENNEEMEGALFGMKTEDMSDSSFLTYADRKAIDNAANKTDEKAIKKAAIKREKDLLEDFETNQETVNTKASFHYRSVHKLLTIQYDTKTVKSSRIMTKNHYGLVNVRTDGETIMCATMKESSDGWTVHTFPARF